MKCRQVAAEFWFKIIFLNHLSAVPFYYCFILTDQKIFLREWYKHCHLSYIGYEWTCLFSYLLNQNVGSCLRYNALQVRVDWSIFVQLQDDLGFVYPGYDLPCSKVWSMYMYNLIWTRLVPGANWPRYDRFHVWIVPQLAQEFGKPVASLLTSLALT